MIIDDGSTDGTGDYLNSVEDDRVQVIHQENQGQQAAANLGISLAQGEFISRMDADDVANPNKLQAQIEFLDQHPNVGLVGTQIYRMGTAANGLASSFPCEHTRIFDDLIHNRHAICNPTIVFRKQLFEEIGGYWDHNIAEDWDMFLRMGEVSRLANLSDPLLSYRFHVGSINGRRMFEAQLFNEYACELARRRNRGDQEISISEFRKSHRSNRWPHSWLFQLDCQSVSQYRIAVAEIYNGQKFSGYSRLGYAMLCSPLRTIQRLHRIFRNRKKNPESAVTS